MKANTEFMTPEDFCDWRARHGLSLTTAAEALGIGRSTVAYCQIHGASAETRDRCEAIDRDPELIVRRRYERGPDPSVGTCGPDSDKRRRARRQEFWAHRSVL